MISFAAAWVIVTLIKHSDVNDEKKLDLSIIVLTGVLDVVVFAIIGSVLKAIFA